MNLTEMLENIESLVAQARAALADEHEGNLREAIHLLSDNAEQARNLIDHW